MACISITAQGGSLYQVRSGVILGQQAWWTCFFQVSLWSVW